MRRYEKAKEIGARPLLSGSRLVPQIDLQFRAVLEHLVLCLRKALLLCGWVGGWLGHSHKCPADSLPSPPPLPRPSAMALLERSNAHASRRSCSQRFPRYISILADWDLTLECLRRAFRPKARP